MNSPEASHSAATTSPSTEPRVSAVIPSSSITPDTFSITIINRQEDVARRGNKLARDVVRDEQRGGKWRRPGSWVRSLSRRYGEDYFVQKGKQQHREAVLEANNAFVVRGADGQFDTETHRAAEAAAAQAKIEQVKLGNTVFGRDTDATAFQQVEQATDSVKHLLVDRLVRRVVADPTIDEATIQGEMRDIVRFATHRKADPEVREQMRRLFGKEAGVSKQRAEYFATDLLQQGLELRHHIHTSGMTPEDALRNVQVTLANTSWGAETKQKLSVADRAIQKIRELPVAGPLVNETTLGAAASVLAFVGLRATGRGIAWATGGGIGAGAVVGGAMAAHERSRNLKIDRAAHEADHEYGLHTPEKATRREQLDVFNVPKATVSELLETDRSTIREGRSLGTLLDGERTDLNLPSYRQELASRIAEIQTRLLYSAREHIGLIEYPGEFSVEQARHDLVKGLAQGREQLQEAYQREGVGQERAQQLAEAMITEKTAAWEKRFQEKQEKQDKDFTVFRRKSALLHGLRGAAIGATSGAIISAIGGWFNRSSNYVATEVTQPSQGSHLEVQHTTTPNEIANGNLATHIRSQRWYHASSNEQGLHTIKEGNALRLLPEKMGMSRGGGMSSLDVPNEARKGELAYAFHLPGQQDAVIAYGNAPDGSLLLDPSDTDTTHQIQLADGRTLQNGLFGKMVINSDALAAAPQGDIATEYGRQAIFALGGADGSGRGQISLGEFHPDRGEWDSIATIHGTGTTPDTISSTKTVRVFDNPSVIIHRTMITEMKPGMSIAIVPKFRKPLATVVSPNSDSSYVPIRLIPTPRALDQPAVSPRRRPSADEKAPQDVLESEAAVSSQNSVDAVIRGLMLRESHYTDTLDADGKRKEVKGEVRAIIADYLKNAVERGMPIEEAQQRFRSFFNFMTLRESKRTLTFRGKNVLSFTEDEKQLIANSVLHSLRMTDMQTREEAMHACTEYFLRVEPHLVRNGSAKRIIEDLVDAFLAKKEIARL